MVIFYKKSKKYKFNKQKIKKYFNNRKMKNHPPPSPAFTCKKKQVPFRMVIRNVEIVLKCFPKHLTREQENEIRQRNGGSRQDEKSE